MTFATLAPSTLPLKFFPTYYCYLFPQPHHPNNLAQLFFSIFPKLIFIFKDFSLFLTLSSHFLKNFKFPTNRDSSKILFDHLGSHFSIFLIATFFRLNPFFQISFPVFLLSLQVPIFNFLKIFNNFLTYLLF